MSRAVDKLLAKLEKQYNQDNMPKSVLRASEIEPYQTFSTGSLSLDYAIGIGGLPTNRVVEIAGAPGAGKTTLVLHTVNNALKMNKDKIAVYLDIENRLTSDWVAAFVEDVDRVIVLRPDHMEQATDMYVEAVQTGEVCIAVLDSIGGAPTQRVVNKSATIGDMGGNALSVGRFSRFAQTYSGKYNCCTIGINQIREDMEGYNRLQTPGGQAWKHAVSLRIELKKGKGKVYDKIGGETLQVGYSVIAKIHKNSLAAPYRSSSYWFYNINSKYGFGVDKTHELVNLAYLTGILENPTSGSYVHHSFDTKDNKIRGWDSVMSYVMENEKVASVIEKEVMETLAKGETSGITSTFSEDESSELVDSIVDVDNKRAPLE